MVDFLKHCNSERIDSPALDYYGTIITFRDLFSNIDHVAIALHNAGVRKGDFVSLCGLNTPEFIYLMYAVNKNGAICNWLGLTSPVSDLKEQLISAGSEFVFVTSASFEKIMEAIRDTQVKQVIIIPVEASMPKWIKFVVSLTSPTPKQEAISWDRFLDYTSQEEAYETDLVKGTDLAMIEYTGGSTGIPKGVMLSNINLNSYYVNFYKTNRCGLSNYNEGDSYLACVPLFLAFGASSGCHGPLCHGMMLVLAPDPTPETLGKLILKKRPNHIVAGSIQIDGLVQAAKRSKRNLSCIQSIMYGGEPANRNWEIDAEKELLKNKMRSPIRNGYGMTETAACILIALKDRADCLVPIGNVNVKITDPDNCITEYGYDQEGELCLSSDTVMMGYFQNEEETAKLIIEDDGQRWIRTEDLASISRDGTIHITGRIKRIYHKLSPEKVGVRVYPMRIEEVISQNPFVEKCAVIGVKDEETAYRTIAFVVLKNENDNISKAKEQIVDSCKENLPESHIPDDYIFISDLPLTRAGKIDYCTLENMK